MSDVLQK